MATSVRLVLEEHYYFIIGTEAYVHQDSEHIFECYPPELTGAGTLPKPVLKFIFKHMLRYGGMNTFLNMIGWGRHSVEIQVGNATSLSVKLRIAGWKPNISMNQELEINTYRNNGMYVFH